MAPASCSQPPRRVGYKLSALDEKPGVLATLRGHPASLLHVGFSPDGRRIVTASSDNTAKLWGASRTFEMLATLHGHAASVNHAEFSPDGRLIVTAGRDGRLKVLPTTLEAFPKKASDVDLRPQRLLIAHPVRADLRDALWRWLATAGHPPRANSGRSETDPKVFESRQAPQGLEKPLHVGRGGEVLSPAGTGYGPVLRAVYSRSALLNEVWALLA